jgi:hypothetical protein
VLADNNMRDLPVLAVGVRTAFESYITAVWPDDREPLLAGGTPSHTISETSNTTSDPSAPWRTSPSTAQTRSFSHR